MRVELPGIVLDGYDPLRISHSSYELRMGGEAFVTQADGFNPKTVLDDGQRVSIPPGQIAHLLTAEHLSIPADVLGFISVKFSLKRKGLVNISGFHVDPGFEGQLVFSVLNAGPQTIVITPGDRAFLLWLCNLDQASDQPYGGPKATGTRQGQKSIPSDDVAALAGDVVNPSALAARVKDLEATLRRIVQAGVAVVTLVILPIVVALVSANASRIGDWVSRNWPF